MSKWFRYIFIIGCIYTFPCHALERIGLNVIYISSNTGVSYEQAIELVNESARIIHDQLGVVIVPRVIRSVSQRRVWKVTEIGASLKVWEKRVAKLRLPRRGRITIVIIPPYQDNNYPDRYWLAGLANMTCGVNTRRRSGGVAVSAAEVVNYLGLPRLQESLISMVHEIGHLLGASHTTSVSIMNSNAIALAHTGLSFRKVSFNEIEYCLTNSFSH